MHCGRLELAGAVEAHQPIAGTDRAHDERRPPVGQATKDAQGHGADVDEADRLDDARGPLTGGDQRPVPRRGALVGVRMPGVVELGEQQIGEFGILRYPDLLVPELVAEPLDSSGRDLGVAHPTSLPDGGRQRGAGR